MFNEKFYVFDVENKNYKVFDNYYRLLCFLERVPYGAFGNSIKDKRWQQKRVSIWEMLRTKDYSNPVDLKNILYVAYDVFMNVINCKKLEKDLYNKDKFNPYKNKYVRYSWRCEHVNYLGFRNGPVPHTGKRNSYRNNFRHIRTTQERRLNYAYPEYTRGERRNLPDLWYDKIRSDIYDKHSWKKQKKRKQWM